MRWQLVTATSGATAWFKPNNLYDLTFMEMLSSVD